MSAILPQVSIGLPTYNRPELLSRVLDGFRNQTFGDFELIISDNASPNPEVKQLCERYAAQDARFRYVRQPVNQGAERNFWFVYDQARAPLFLWASDDDLWPADFLERGVGALKANPWASAWFCQVVNIDASGDIVRVYPSFKRFQSSWLKSTDLVRFLWEPELMGKANLIYSIFRRQTLAKIVDIFRGRPATWGTDMNLVYGHLCRFDLLVDDQVVLQKRVTDGIADLVAHPRSQIYPRQERAIYFENYRRAAAGSGYWLFTAAVLVARSAYDYWASGRAARDYDEWELRRDFENWRKETRRDFEHWRTVQWARVLRVLGRIRARLLSRASR